MPEDEISTRDKIDILFREYTALRQEVIMRTNNQYTLLTVYATLVIAVVAWFINSSSTSRHTATLVLVLGGLSLTFWFLFWIILQNIKRYGYRLMEIEARINLLAGHTDDPLLEWETRWGGVKIGPFRSRPLASKPEAALEPDEQPVSY